MRKKPWQQPWLQRRPGLQRLRRQPQVALRQWTVAEDAVVLELAGHALAFGVQEAAVVEAGEDLAKVALTSATAPGIAAVRADPRIEEP